MFKKILLGAVLVGSVAVLVAGAIVRTNAKSGEGAAGAAAGHEQEAMAAGRGGQGQGREARDAAPASGALPQGWLTVTGAVSAVASDQVEIRTATGVVTLEGQPLSYVREQRFALKVGDRVTVAGFEDGGAFRIAEVTNLESGSAVTLRDTSGRPAWAGRGRGK